jgi:hypothetical protein
MQELELDRSSQVFMSSQRRPASLGGFMLIFPKASIKDECESAQWVLGVDRVRCEEERQPISHHTTCRARTGEPPLAI